MLHVQMELGLVGVELGKEDAKRRQGGTKNQRLAQERGSSLIFKENECVKGVF